MNDLDTALARKQHLRLLAKKVAQLRVEHDMATASQEGYHAAHPRHRGLPDHATARHRRGP